MHRAPLIVLAMAGAALLCSSCGSDKSSDSEAMVYTILTVNTEGQKDWFAALVKEVNAKNPGTDLRFNATNGDDYQKTISKTIKRGGAPAMYHVWSGHTVRADARSKIASDLTDFYKDEKLESVLVSTALDAARVDGRYAMIPQYAEVTNVLWVNRGLLREHLGDKADPAKWNWDDLVAACRKLRKAGVTPISIGNQDSWVLGNLAGHLISRLAGEKRYAEVLSLKKGTTLADEGFVRGLQRLAELAKAGAFPKSMAQEKTEAGVQRFMRGEAAMCAMGSWLTEDISKDLAFPKKDLDCINLPAVPGGKGKQDSVIAVYTGFCVGRGNPNKKKALALAREFLSEKKQRQWARWYFSPRKGIGYGKHQEHYFNTLAKMLTESETVVDPPDTGYSVAVGNTLYTAAAAVCTGTDPKAALELAESNLAHKRALAR